MIPEAIGYEDVYADVEVVGVRTKRTPYAVAVRRARWLQRYLDAWAAREGYVLGTVAITPDASHDSLMLEQPLAFVRARAVKRVDPRVTRRFIDGLKTNAVRFRR